LTNHSNQANGQGTKDWGDDKWQDELKMCYNYRLEKSHFAPDGKFEAPSMRAGWDKIKNSGARTNFPKSWAKLGLEDYL
jgi:hypothetical protein